MADLQVAGIERARYEVVQDSGQQSASSATPLTAVIESPVQPTAPTQTAYIYTRVGIPFGVKGISHGTAGSVMAHNNRATNSLHHPMPVRENLPQARRPYIPDILDSVVLHDLSSGHYIRGTSCPRIPLSSTQWAAKG